MAFADEGAADAGGEEAAAVVDHDRRLADLLHEVHGAGQVSGEVFLPTMISTSGIFSTGEKKCRPMKLVGLRRGFGQAGDRQGRGVGGEHRLLGHRRLGLLGRLGLDLAVLEHRLDHELDVLQRAEVRRRRHLGQQGVAPGLVEPAALDELVELARDVGLALVGGGLVAVDQHDVEPGLHRDGGDARAHQAGAEDADLLVLLLRHALGPARELVRLLQAEEQRADHALGHGIAQQRDEVARLDAQRRIERQLQAFVDAAHDRLGRGIDAVGLAGDHGVAADEGLHARRAPHLAAREARGLEALAVPRLHGAAVDRLGALAGILRHDLLGRPAPSATPWPWPASSSAGTTSWIRPRPLAASTVRSLPSSRIGAAFITPIRRGMRCVPPPPGSRPILTSGWPTLALRVGRGDAVVAGEADLEAAAQRGAVDRRHDRLAAGLLAAEHLLQLAELVHQLGGIRRVGAQQHLEVGAGDEVGLGRGQDDALDLVVLDAPPRARRHRPSSRPRSARSCVRPGMSQVMVAMPSLSTL